MTGPVQVLVLGFEEPAFSGEAMAELGRLGDAGVVRLLDVLLVTRTADGGIETMPAPPGADPESGSLVAALLGEPGPGAVIEDGSAAAGPSAWSLDDAVPPTGTAAVALIEHTWAQPLVLAIRGAGGQLLGETWLGPEDAAVLETLAAASE